jgi:acetamidase/formamidase
MTMGFDADPNQAIKMAIREMIEFLVTQKHLTRDDAYALMSVAVDFSIGENVDGKKSVHALIPKAIFVAH